MNPNDLHPTAHEIFDWTGWVEPVWERQPGESARWHARFRIYLRLGPERSIDSAWRAFREAEGAGKISRAPGSWKRNARQWRWRDRAWEQDAWQEMERSHAEREEAEARRRLAFRSWESQIEAAIEIVTKADLRDLDTEEARKLLPSAVRLLQNAVGGLRHLPKDPNRTLGGVIRIAGLEEEDPQQEADETGSEDGK